MRTPEAEIDGPGVGTAAKLVAEKASAIARLEIELASMELKTKIGALGFGLGLLVGALIVFVYAIGFTFATITAAFATFLPVWLSLLVVTAILAFVGIKKVQRGSPPVPEQAIDEAKLTTQALKSNGSG